MRTTSHEPLGKTTCEFIVLYDVEGRIIEVDDHRALVARGSL